MSQSLQEDRTKKKYTDYVTYQCSVDSPDPMTLSQALSSEKKQEWCVAIERELDSLHKCNAWKLVDRPENRNIVKNKWVFNTKKNGEGEIIQHEARLVAKGFSQQFGVDYEEVYSPIIRHSTMRVLFALASHQNLNIDHLDVETAFLNGDLTEDIFMEQPQGFAQEGQEKKVCQLNKAIYGLKQSSRVWNLKVKEVVEECGYKQCKTDSCLFQFQSEKSGVYLALYVDDFFVFYNDKDIVNILKDKLKDKFKIKDLGPVLYALGIQINRNRRYLKGTIDLNLTYVRDKMFFSGFVFKLSGGSIT